MTYRVVRLRTGETYACYALQHYHQAVAAVIDAARIAGEPFAVYSADDRLVTAQCPARAAPPADAPAATSRR